MVHLLRFEENPRIHFLFMVNVLKFLTQVSNKMAYTNSVDPDSTGPEEAVWSGSTRDDQKVLGPCTLGITKSRTFAITSQYNLPLPQCTFSNAVPVCLPLHHRSLLPPNYSSTASMTPSLLPKYLPWRLVFRLGNRWRSKGAKFGEHGGCRMNLKLHLVAATTATRGVGWCIILQDKTPLVHFPLLFFTISWPSHLSSST